MATHFRPEITLYLSFPAENFSQIQGDGPGQAQARGRARPGPFFKKGTMLGAVYINGFMYNFRIYV